MATDLLFDMATMADEFIPEESTTDPSFDFIANDNFMEDVNKSPIPHQFPKETTVDPSLDYFIKETNTTNSIETEAPGQLMPENVSFIDNSQFSSTNNPIFFSTLTTAFDSLPKTNFLHNKTKSNELSSKEKIEVYPVVTTRSEIEDSEYVDTQDIINIVSNQNPESTVVMPTTASVPFNDLHISVTTTSEIETIIPTINNTSQNTEIIHERQAIFTTESPLDNLSSQATSLETNFFSFNATETTFNTSPRPFLNESRRIPNKKLMIPQSIFEKNMSALFPNLEDSHSNSSFGIKEKVDDPSAILLSVLASCFTLLVLFILFMVWILRKNKNQSKVYLNYKLSKHKSYITRPMQPNILPNEVPHSLKVLKTKPRPPILLIHELDSTNAPNVDNRPKIPTSESCDSGIDNLAFLDSSLDGQSANSQITKSTENLTQKCRPVPKYCTQLPKRKIQNTAAMTRVYSSDGSIFPTSPSLSNCFVPPPPYSPHIKDKDFNFSLNFSSNYSKITTPEENSSAIVKNKNLKDLSHV